MTVPTCTDFFLDLPASMPLIDLSKMADLDMGKLPKVEESGERCMRRIQEFIINELSSSEAVVLPEDKLQRLVVGVCGFLRTFNELEFVTFQFSLVYKPSFYCRLSTSWRSPLTLRRLQLPCAWIPSIPLNVH